MDGTVCPGIHSPLEFLTSFFQGKPPPLIQKFFTPSVRDFGLNLNPPLERGGGGYPLCLLTCYFTVQGST